MEKKETKQKNQTAAKAAKEQSKISASEESALKDKKNVLTKDEVKDILLKKDTSSAEAETNDVKVKNDEIADNETDISSSEEKKYGEDVMNDSEQSEDKPVKKPVPNIHLQVLNSISKKISRTWNGVTYDN